MTRSSEAALDESQLALGQRCEGLLGAPKWHRAHTTTHEGLLLRLTMIKDAGLPAMRVVPNEALQRLGRIPRSHEGHQVDALDAVRKAGAGGIFNYPKAVVLLCAAAEAPPPRISPSRPPIPQRASASHACLVYPPSARPPVQLLAPLEAAELVRVAADRPAVELARAAAGDAGGRHVWRPRRRGALEGAGARRVRRLVQAVRNRGWVPNCDHKHHRCRRPRDLLVDCASRWGLEPARPRPLFIALSARIEHRCTAAGAGLGLHRPGQPGARHGGAPRLRRRVRGHRRRLVGRVRRARVGARVARAHGTRVRAPRRAAPPHGRP